MKFIDIVKSAEPGEILQNDDLQIEIVVLKDGNMQIIGKNNVLDNECLCNNLWKRKDDFNY